MIDIKTFAKPKKSGGTSGGGSSSTYLTATAAEAVHAARADKATKADSAEKAAVADRAVNAQSANYASKAGDIDVDAETLQRFLRKDKVEDGHTEEVEGMVAFQESVTFEGEADFQKSVTFEGEADFQKSVTFEGEADFQKGLTADTLRSTNFDKNLCQGYGLEKESNASHHLYLTDLTVWGKMVVSVLEILKTKYAGGNICLSPAGGTISLVTPVTWDNAKGVWEKSSDAICEGWKCHVLADDGDNAMGNPWREGDQVRCQAMGNLAVGTTHTATNRSYWRTIMENGVSDENECLYADDGTALYDGKKFYWIVVGKHTAELDGYTEKNAPTETTDYPWEGDAIVLDGSRTDSSRQALLMLNTYGSGAPSIVGLRGVKDYTHDGCEVFELSPEYVRILAEKLELVASDGTQTNMEDFMGEMTLDNKKFEVNMTELSTSYNSLKNTTDGLPLKTEAELTAYTSQIKQTARDISLTVSEKTVGRRNMLTGSAFRKKNDGYQCSIDGDWIGSTYTLRYYGDQGVLMNGGIGGTNCLKVKSYNDGSSLQYMGAFFRYVNFADSQNIRIEPGKKYTISCWTKCDTVDARICIECVYKSSITAVPNERCGSPEYVKGKNAVSVASDEVGEWVLRQTTIDTSNAGNYEYVSVHFFCTHKMQGTTATAWFCRPMMEEGDEYNGWTLSEQDYDYVGGNLLDNTTTLEAGGNLATSEGTVQSDGFEAGVCATYGKPSSGGITELLQWGTADSQIGLEANTDYILSFWAKGTSLAAYAYRSDGDAEMVTEDCQGGSRDSQGGDDGNADITLTSQWRRYWVHWRTKSRTEKIPQMVMLRTATEAWVAKPKLEVGATMTEWTEKHTDLVSRKDLLATGIDITSNQITLTGNTLFQDNDGTQTALFSNGKIQASLIDADNIEVKHLWAKDGKDNKVGYFGNTEEDATKVDDSTNAPLFLGGETAAKSSFYVTDKGAMHSTSGTIGGFKIGTSSIGTNNLGDGSSSTGAEMYLYENGIIFNDRTSKSRFQALIGTGYSLGMLIPMRINVEAEQYDSIYAANIYVKNYNDLAANSLTTRVGLNLSVQGGGTNFAILASHGNIVCNGMVAGVRHSKLTLTKRNIIYIGYLNPIENNVWFVNTSANNCTLMLPSLTSVKNALAYTTAGLSSFSVRLTIIGDADMSYSVTIKGRTDDTSFKSAEYPEFVNNGNGITLSAGVVRELILAYDGSNYKAYLVN